MALNREDGIKAIIELQAFAGITETPEQAAQGWDSMSDDVKEQTMLAYRAVIGGDPDIVIAPKTE